MPRELHTFEHVTCSGKTVPEVLTDAAHGTVLVVAPDDNRLDTFLHRHGSGQTTLFGEDSLLPSSFDYHIGDLPETSNDSLPFETNAKYKRPAPPSTEYDYLHLIAAADRVYLEGARTNDPAADRDHAPVPIPDSLPSESVTQVGNATRVVATGLTPHLVTHTIALPVDTLLESTALGESS